MTRLAPALLLLAGCAALPPAGAPLAGEWGGAQIGLTLTGDGGSIEYDCASGTIGKVVPDRAGRFSATGTHTPGHGGPAIEGEILPTYRTRFDGNVRGDRMTLTGRVENGVLLGPFTLMRGAEPGVFRCL